MIRYSDYCKIGSLGQRFIDVLANYLISGDIEDAELEITSNSGVTINIFLGNMNRLEIRNDYIVIGTIQNNNTLINLENVLSISIRGELE